MADRAIPDLTPEGLLPPGDHPTNLADIEERFGRNARRRGLVRGLREALSLLASAGVEEAYVGGDLTTAEPLPRAVAWCYDLPADIDERGLEGLSSLYPDPSRLSAGSAGRFGVELFAAATASRPAGEPFLGLLRRGWDETSPKIVQRPPGARGVG